jgi:hypothetical protein
VDCSVLKGLREKLVYITLQYTSYQPNPLQSEITQTCTKGRGTPSVPSLVPSLAFALGK